MRADETSEAVRPARQAERSAEPRQPARQAELRRHNLGLVLEHVARAEPDGTSRAAIAESAGLTRATVSALTEQLLALGLVEWAPTAGPSGVGRPASPIRLARGRWAGLGLEVGADYLAALVLDLTGETRARAEVRGDFGGRPAAETLSVLGNLGGRTWGQARAAQPELAPLGIGLAVPGIVRDGVVLDAPRLGWENVDAGGALASALAAASPQLGEGGGTGAVDVVVSNEATLAALAEAAERGPETFLYVSAGVGVGGAYVVGGEPMGGVHGFASELGHVTVDPSGPLCRCGATGCLEQYVGAGALSHLTAEEIGRALGIAVASAVNVLDAGRVVLSGTLAAALPQIRRPLAAELATRVLAHPWAPVEVDAALVADLPALRGAALAPIRDVLARPERLEPPERV